MGWFKKKQDPISDRARALNAEIAALEAQIARLSARQQDEGAAAPPAEPSPRTNHKPAAPATGKAGGPRLRSTALPHGPTVPAQARPQPDGRDPIFEDVPGNPFKSQAEKRPATRQTELGIRKSDMSAVWRRWLEHFRGPTASNPKLVSYLAAGSIQGLRPLRYEKRVARNRFLWLVFCLILVLLGLFAAFFRR